MFLEDSLQRESKLASSVPHPASAGRFRILDSAVQIHSNRYQPHTLRTTPQRDNIEIENLQSMLALSKYISG